jgi:hypothetical protein
MASIDNITLALVSLKKELEDYLDDQGWKRLYQIYLYGDSYLKNREFVLKKTSNSQIQLPVLIIDTGTVRNEIQEMGDESGRDVIVLSLILMAVEENQLRTLGNLIRRKVEDLVFDVKNYDSARREVLGTSELSDVILTDASNPDSSNIADRYVVVINITLEMNADSFL